MVHFDIGGVFPFVGEFYIVVCYGGFDGVRFDVFTSITWLSAVIEIK